VPLLIIYLFVVERDRGNLENYDARMSQQVSQSRCYEYYKLMLLCFGDISRTIKGSENHLETSATLDHYSYLQIDVDNGLVCQTLLKIKYRTFFTT